MADFCKACSHDHFGKDFGELAGLTTKEAWAEEKAAVVICEGCGPIQVDPEGVCVSEGCLRAGQPGHGGIPFVEPAPEATKPVPPPDEIAY